MGSLSVGSSSAHPELNEMVRAYVEAPLPAVASNLTESSPLIFHHQRKAGGESLKSALVSAAGATNLSTFAPCYGGVNCDTYTFNGVRAAVYAGHLGWGERRHLARTGSLDVNTSTWRTAEQEASCLTAFREPIARLESCYYFRFIEASAGLKVVTDPHFQCISNLPASELRSVLSTWRSMYGGGCLAEPFRIFSGQTSEEELAGLAEQAPGSPTGIAMLAMTLRHLAGCVPLILEEPASLALGAHWFPQLAPAFQLPLPKLNAAPNVTRRCPLAPHTRAMLTELAAAETVLYDAARRRAAIMLATLQ